MAVFAVAWLSPPVLWGFRRWRDRRAVRRVSFWVCPCGLPNPPESIMCSRCAKTTERGWVERLSASKVGGLFRSVGGAWRGAGWALYYLLPFAAATSVGLWRSGPPLHDLFAAAGAVCALGGTVLAGRALGRDGGGLVGRIFSLTGAGSLAGFFALFAALAVVAPFSPSMPLAVVHLLPNGEVRFETSGGLRLNLAGTLQEGKVEFHVRSAFLSWPLFHVRQTVPLYVGTEPLADRWTQELLSAGARRLTKDDPYRLRVALKEDVLFEKPGGPYLVRDAADGAGLVLVEPPRKT